MKILTLTQPWATLVAIGAKHIETRSWTTSYRGPIAIHAGAGLGPVGGKRGLNDLVMDGGLFFNALRETITVAPRVLDTGRLPRGAIVAVAELVSCEPTDGADALYGGGWHIVGDVEGRWHLTDQERAFGDYSPGRFAWLLADVRRLVEPLPYRGAQGLRDLPADVVAEVERNLPYA